jgi:hypothetical protein
MKDVYEVLRLKENEISRVELEVEALRVAAPLLSDDEESGSNSRTTSQAKGLPQPISVPGALNPKPQPDGSAEWRSKGRAWS